MVKKISIPRGTTDILPAEIPLWRVIETKSRQILQNYNYKEIRTPLFEETGLFKRSLGQNSDVVNKQLLELVSDKEEGFSLRPEGTASVVRAYIESSLDRKENSSKLFYMGPMFRGERPQKGRLRQFHQIGVEVIGPLTEHPFVDAEVIALNMRLLEAFGLSNFELKINTLGSTQDKENFSKSLRVLLKPRISDLCNDCQDRFERNVFRILDCKNKTCRNVVGSLKIDNSHLTKESRIYFDQVQEALDGLKVKYAICTDLVRGLDYYTHTVFEITSSSLGSQDALSAGGRYNDLVKQLGGPQVPAIGFALGIERVLLAMPRSVQANVVPLSTYIIALDEKSLQKGFGILGTLRASNISSDMSYRVTSMKSQMRLADKTGAHSVIIIGESELEREMVTLKDMKTGDQEEIAVGNNDCPDLCFQLIERYQ